MIQVLAIVVPIGLAGAISPVLLTEQTVLLASSGTRAARAFAAAVFLVLAILVTVLVVFGHTIELPKAPKLSASLDIVVGLPLLGLAWLLHKRTAAPKPQGSPDKNKKMNPRAAFAFGIFSMSTNFTTIALMVPGVKEIAAGQLDVIERVIAGAVLILLAAIPAWLLLLLTAVAPQSASRVLGGFSNAIDRHGRMLSVALVGLIGAYFVTRGIVRLID